MVQFSYYFERVLCLNNARLKVLLLALMLLLGSLYIPGSANAKAPRNALQGQFHLSHVVKIYVPGTIHQSEPVDNTPYVDKTLTRFSTMFGGATAINGAGGWVDDSGQLIKEKVTIVYSFTDQLTNKRIDEVVAYAKALKLEMTQSSVSLEVDGKLYFIE